MKNSSTIQTGLLEVDNIMKGLNNKLTIIASRPAVGKSALASSIAINVAKNNKTVLYFSLEMTEAELTKRVLSSVSMLEFNLLKKEPHINEHSNTLAQAAIAISKMSFFIDDKPDYTIDEIKGVCTKIKSTKEIGLILIDYVQLLNYKAKTPHRDAILELATNLKRLTEDLTCPVIALSQLGRDLERRIDKRPNLADFKEFSPIADIADSVMLLYRDDFYNPNNSEKNIAEIIIAKNLSGDTGTAKVTWNKKIYSFEDLR